MLVVPVTSLQRMHLPAVQAPVKAGDDKRRRVRIVRYFVVFVFVLLLMLFVILFFVMV